MTIKLANAANLGPRADWPSSYVYIGRPGPFGNPCAIGPSVPRVHAVDFYEAHLYSAIEGKDTALWLAFQRLLDRVRSGEDITLVCHCAPLPCHGDIIIEAIEDELEALASEPAVVLEQKDEQT